MEGADTTHWSDYEGDWTPRVLGGGSRHDRTRSLRIDVHNRALTVGGFSPRVSVVHEQRDSNAQLLDYERVFGELSFVTARETSGNLARAPKVTIGQDHVMPGKPNKCLRAY